MQATALVNEAYLQLVDSGAREWQNRAQFFGVAAQLMRRVLVDEARAQNRFKRGGNTVRVSLAEADNVAAEGSVELVALDDALNSLAAFDKRKSRIIELRYFGGLSVEEAAEVLKISPRTLIREWSLAQAWLYRELSQDES